MVDSFTDESVNRRIGEVDNFLTLLTVLLKGLEGWRGWVVGSVTALQRYSGGDGIPHPKKMVYTIYLYIYR